MSYNKNYNIGGVTFGGISGFWLKMIAVITMFIDHTAASVGIRYLNDAIVNGVISYEQYELWYNVYYAMRCVGRMAFPIYCFLLVEGFNHTRSKLKYAARLFLFALISEYPFDLALQNGTWTMENNNVFWTLFLGLLAIMALDLIFTKCHFLDRSKSVFAWFGVTFLRCVAMAAVILGAMAVAELVLHTDYGAAGIAAIVIIYLFKQYPITGYALAVMLLVVMSSEIEFWAMLMLIPLYFYNGTRGKQAKYFFYAFYPVHLLILGLICIVLKI